MWFLKKSTISLLNIQNEKRACFGACTEMNIMLEKGFLRWGKFPNSCWLPQYIAQTNSDKLCWRQISGIKNTEMNSFKNWFSFPFFWRVEYRSARSLEVSSPNSASRCFTETKSLNWTSKSIFFANAIFFLPPVHGKAALCKRCWTSYPQRCLHSRSRTRFCKVALKTVAKF